ncbi:MAG: transposase [Desulfobacteraceae bacterium]|nr:transposase [Desulfobacteraceae bacterium]
MCIQGPARSFRFRRWCDSSGIDSIRGLLAVGIVTAKEELKDSNALKIMCVPIDYAKKDHVVMFCNGYGDVLRKPFSIKNSPEGINYLTKQVTRSCRHRGINPKHVFFSVEDVGSYAENFVNALRSKEWLVAGVNAHDAKNVSWGRTTLSACYLLYFVLKLGIFKP